MQSAGRGRARGASEFRPQRACALARFALAQSAREQEREQQRMTCGVASARRGVASGRDAACRLARVGLDVARV